MPTHNPRINITFDERVVSILTSMAKHEHKSLAGLTKELVLEALERREDLILTTLAESRDKKNVKLIKHDDAWK